MLGTRAHAFLRAVSHLWRVVRGSRFQWPPISIREYYREPSAKMSRDPGSDNKNTRFRTERGQITRESDIGRRGPWSQTTENKNTIRRHQLQEVKTAEKSDIIGHSRTFHKETLSPNRQPLWFQRCLGAWRPSTLAAGLARTRGAEDSRRGRQFLDASLPFGRRICEGV